MVAWTRFWTAVTCCGPDDGVRWRTHLGKHNRPDRVLAHDGDQESEWSVGELLDPRRQAHAPGHPRAPDNDVDEGLNIGGNERLLLHIPESALT
jgi:hypothetical protein